MNRLGIFLILMALMGAAMPALAAKSGNSQPDSVSAPWPGFAGSFLVARAAEFRGDWTAAEEAYAAVAARDLANSADFLHRQGIILLNQGRFDEALQVSRAAARSSGSAHLTRLLEFAAAARTNDVGAARLALRDISNEGLGQFIKPFFTAWVESADHHPAAAYAALEKLEQIPSLRPMMFLHIALIADAAGDTDKARTNLAQMVMNGPSYRTIVLASQFYLRHQMFERRAALLRSASAADLDPVLLSQLMTLSQPSPQLEIRQLNEGIAEAVFGVAELLQQEGANDVALPYLRIAQALRPGYAMADLSIATLLIREGQYDTAREIYQSISQSPDVGMIAQSRLVDLNRSLGQLEDARTHVRALLTQDATSSAAQRQLGELEAQSGNFEAAVAAFSEGLRQSVANDFVGDQAGLLFARAQAYHMQQNIEAAQADLESALKATPDNPDVLNYLGYLWADRGIHLDEAEQMIRRAMQLRSDDPDVLDSLGWVKFRQGDFAQAVRWLELASELRPYDPAINDHLGDAYWAQGRQLEARYQWQRAMTYRDVAAPLLVSVEELRQKIATGPLFNQQTAARR